MDTLKKNLTKIGLDETQLSRRELNTITKIQELYDNFESKNETLKKQLQNNKFNRKVIKDSGICSRQTLYTNEIVNKFVSLLEEKSEGISDVDEAKYISRIKYNELKAENVKLISNAVDVAIKDAEIDRLTRENKQLHDRVDNLVKRLEEEHNNNVRLKKAQWS